MTASALNRSLRAFAALLCLALFTAACSAKTVALQPEIPARHTVAEFADDEPVIGVSDPWEGFNRGMYRFNYNLDMYLFLPVVHAYETCTATFVQKGVSNFFSNLGEVGTLYNSLFQAKGKKAATTLGRFLTNSTLGIGGLFDPATHFGLKKQSEDFGRTLGTWGVPTGPYLVLPAFGPSTARGATGFAVDAGIMYGIGTVVDPFRNVSERPAIIAGISTLQAINMRHTIKFYYYESGSPFEYNLVRYLYYKKGELSLLK